jgi:hypothetical protein
MYQIDLVVQRLTGVFSETDFMSTSVAYFKFTKL